MANRTSKHMLLLEGPDDLYVFVALFEYYGVPKAEPNQPEPGKVTLQHVGGFEKLRESFKTRLKPRDEDIPLEQLGVVVDADMDLPARWDSLRAVLEDSGYHDVPRLPAPEGVILKQEDRPTVGVWIMPDNTLPGMIEHFVRFLVPEDDTLWARAGACVDAIPPSEQRFIPSHTIKAHMHTWLAWQEEPGRPMGQAITKRFLHADVPQAQELIAWLRRLFSI